MTRASTLRRNGIYLKCDPTALSCRDFLLADMFLLPEGILQATGRYRYNAISASRGARRAMPQHSFARTISGRNANAAVIGGDVQIKPLIGPIVPAHSNEYRLKVAIALNCDNGLQFNGLRSDNQVNPAVPYRAAVL